MKVERVYVFVQTPGDPCFYVSSEGEDPVIIAVYVEDIIFVNLIRKG